MLAPRHISGNCVTPMEMTSLMNGLPGSMEARLTECGNDLHGPYLGPDGFFYWTKEVFGNRRTNSRTEGRTAPALRISIGRDRMAVSWRS